MPRLSRIILKGHIWLVATSIPVLVKLLPLKKLLAVLTPTGKFGPYRSFPPQEIARMVHHRLRRPRSMRSRPCLREGLTLFYFLKLAAAPAVIHIAVHPMSAKTDQLRAHCWVMLDGQALTAPIIGPSVTIMTHG